MATPNETELEQMAKSVFYELNELVGSHLFLVAMRKLKQQPPEWNWILEAFVVHTRNMIDFFYFEVVVRRRWDTDVFATLYCPDWPTKRPELSAFLNRRRERAHKQLAHLSTERIKLKDESWETDQIRDEIVALYRLFLESLDERRRGWFDPATALRKEV